MGRGLIGQLGEAKMHRGERGERPLAARHVLRNARDRGIERRRVHGDPVAHGQCGIDLAERLWAIEFPPLPVECRRD